MPQYLNDLLQLEEGTKPIEIVRVRFFKHANQVILNLHTQEILPFSCYCSIIHLLEEMLGSCIKLEIASDSSSINENDLYRYLSLFYKTNSSMKLLESASIHYELSTNTITYLFIHESDTELAQPLLNKVQAYLNTIGMGGVQVTSSIFVEEMKEVETVVQTVKQKPSEPVIKTEGNKRYRRLKKEDYPLVQLKEVHESYDQAQFTGTIFNAEETVKKYDGKTIKTLSVYDGTDAMAVKCFEGKCFSKEELDAFKVGMKVKVFGKIDYDKFANDLVCLASGLEEVPAQPIVDTAKEKRIEFHMHTNMSEMDGICEPAEVVKYAWSLGHEGICITDHADVQSFVKAYNTAKGLKKSNPERSFKVGLGCEMNMANDTLTIVRNATDDSIDDSTFICFDLETTGLSCYYDSIIEFGGVKVKNGVILDRLQLFIKPPFSIPSYITRKTNITNDMVKDASPFSVAYKTILDWIGDGVLVAHNATFDYHFLNEELRRIGQPKLMNPVIDTLDMARAILKERHFYRLGNLSNFYKINYDEEVAHRADYDAEVLNSVFACLLNDASKKGAKTLRDLQEKIQDEDAYKKVRPSHIIVMVKNKAGLKRLYQAVSESCTKTLVVMSKSSKEGVSGAAEPRIKRSFIEADRSNFLIGTSCLNNEVFELACNGDDERLKQAMSWYDYVEVQPPANYTTYVALGSVPSMDRLKDVLKRMIQTAKSLGIPVIADSDAHYCTKDQKIFRDVYIMSQGVGGVNHPLYIRDEALRIRTKNPDQHLRLTDEMKEAFCFLEDDALIQEIVIDNPHKLFNELEEVQPVPSGTYPPEIEGSDDKLREICHTLEMNMYGFEGKIPDIVSTRLNEELDNIIRNGFGVHYYIAHLLVKKSNSDGYVVGSRGSVGSSFTATMSGITEVNPLAPHYLCPHCHYSEFITDGSVKSGFDLPDKTCPHCGSTMRGNGHNIPFQTFLGFNADKTPDIDLNFSNEYQARAHAFIKEVFGEDHAFRAGTIGTVADKTAFGYVSGYCEKMNITDMRKVMKDYLALGCTNVKRTTGQHPGGIIIIPNGYDAEDFTPVQYPANDPTADWKTTHYDFHDIHDNVLKFDILGHVDPTAMRLLTNISKVNPTTIPMNDPETLSLFYTDEALQADPRIYKKETGALGLPEFGTRITRRILEETRPHTFSDLVIISGLSHGTDVWTGNAESLIQDGTCTLQEVIGCRDDIMTYLLEKQLEPLTAFKIMESVRKGKGLSVEQEKAMREKNVPDWYIDSCKKIKYMFPKAHAVAYVMMAVRLGWYKVHEPHSFYIQYLTLRCDAYEIETMMDGMDAIQERMNDIRTRQQDRSLMQSVTNKEKALYDTLEVCEELYARGYKISNIDLYKSKAKEFTVEPSDPHTIIPPFIVVDGLGANVAESVVKARAQGEFLSKQDILKRTQLSEMLLKKLEKLGCIKDLPETNQLSLF